jgi:hypothetical protein
MLIIENEPKDNSYLQLLDTAANKCSRFILVKFE